ncbi:MAG TPA: hypothetical protein VFE61_17065 [Candidatus Sulfotelmatobacter sp.]|jgi:hypothetical protein|nr:hypothetical protein [Candidatus Sulfotelmatobacter sp.]
MKRLISWALLLSGALVVTLVPVQAAASHCSTASTAGDWAYTYTGTIFTPGGSVPAATVGHFTQSATGGVSGNQTRSVAGSSGVEDISGSVTVNKDCSANANIDVLVDGQVQRTAVLAIMYDSDGNHARMIFQSLTLPDGTNVPVVLTLDANRLNTKK